MNDFLSIITDTPKEINFPIKTNNNEDFIKDEKNSRSFHEIFSAKNNEDSSPKTTLSENKAEKKDFNEKNIKISHKKHPDNSKSQEEYSENTQITNETQKNDATSNTITDINAKPESNNRDNKDTSPEVDTKTNFISQNKENAKIDGEEKIATENFSQQDETSGSTYIEIEIFYFEFYRIINSFNNYFVNNQTSSCEISDQKFLQNLFLNYNSNKDLLNNFSWTDSLFSNLTNNKSDMMEFLFGENAIAGEIENLNSSYMSQDFQFFFAMQFKINVEDISLINNFNFNGTDQLNFSDINYFEFTNELSEDSILSNSLLNDNLNAFFSDLSGIFNEMSLAGNNIDQSNEKNSVDIDKTIMNLIETIFSILNNASKNQNPDFNIIDALNNNIVSLDYSVAMQTLSQKNNANQNIFNQKNTPELFFNIIANIIGDSTEDEASLINLNKINNQLSQIREKLLNNEINLNSLNLLGNNGAKNTINFDLFTYSYINPTFNENIINDKNLPNKINQILSVSRNFANSTLLPQFLESKGIINNFNNYFSNNPFEDYKFQGDFDNETPYIFENSQNTSPHLLKNNNQTFFFSVLKKEINTLFNNFYKSEAHSENNIFVNNFFINTNNNEFEKNKSIFENFNESNGKSQVEISLNNFFIQESNDNAAINEQSAIKENKGLTKDTFFDFIKDKYLTNLTQGHKKTTLYLNPPELGKVKVDINITKNNEISAIFNVEHPEIREIVEKSIEALKVALESKGYNITQIAVKQSDSNAGASLFFDNFSKNEQNNRNDQNKRQNTSKSNDSVISESTEIKQILRTNPNSISIII